MTYLTTSGRWLLLGIPVLILIYLIRSKHQETVVSSTYLWKLSEKFMKKRVPLQKLKKLLIFLAELLLIVALSMIAGIPVWEDGDATHYIVILDSSASMQTKDDNGESRFDRALEMLEELAEKTENGHRVSLITAGELSSVVFTQEDSEAAVRRSLSSLTCGNDGADLDAALDLAAGLSKGSYEAEILILTDRPEGENENVSVVDLSEDEWNLSVLDMEYQIRGKMTEFTGELFDTRSETVSVGLKINGKLKKAVNVDLTAGEVSEVSFTYDRTSFDTAEIYVEAADGLPSDNSYAVCRSGSVSATVYILSNSPLYLEKVFSVQDGCSVTVSDTVPEEALSGYDLYIFDGIVPEDIPVDGSVLYIDTATLPEGISVLNTVRTEGALRLSEGASTEFSEELHFQNSVISSYGILSAADSWETLLTCGDEPVLMAKRLSSGLREMVLSFDIHDSNLPLQADFVTLARNLLRYSVPTILKDSDLTIGEPIELSILPGATALYVRLPDGTSEEVNIEGIYGTYVPEVTGLFTAVEIRGESGEYMDFFVHLPDSERMPASEVSGISVELKESRQKKSAVRNVAYLIAIGALVLLILEWEGYYHEQY